MHFEEKLGQLKETLEVRFGTMIVGHALTGKSTLISHLQSVMNALHQRYKPDQEEEELNQKSKYYWVEKVVINPKSVSLGELYGYENQNKDWIDGLASHYIRDATKK